MLNLWKICIFIIFEELNVKDDYFQYIEKEVNAILYSKKLNLLHNLFLLQKFKSLNSLRKLILNNFLILFCFSDHPQYHKFSLVILFQTLIL